ncbi:hypothetical protein B0J13DRAFT_617294 [Dactylonectria estremocensis]|uniref:PABC domain-containing protein n=1 Tax=Dactylonectria estremocensis TaxID=1079267 RepID=A0A9P9FGH8_9HYPO|nr:hypothetical protein B0J13DRAFT_617294 [Dactylonectria estremocensis]
MVLGVVAPALPVTAVLPSRLAKQILGEMVCPKIQAIDSELAGKITGMLLEMDNAELVNL